MKFPIQQYLLIAIATVAAISVGVCLFAVAQIEAMHIAVALNDKAKFDAIYMEASHWIFIQLALIVAVGFAAGFLALQRIRTRSREITEQVQCLLEGTKLPESAADEFASVTTVLKRLEHELERMSQQVRSLSQASRDGDLRLRSAPERLTGPFRDVMEDINTILNQALDPVNAQAAILRKMAEGTLDSRITEEFAGDHAKISDAINKVADIASLAMAEFDALITAFEAGDYDRRAQTEQFAGSWKRIMLGVNNVLGTLHRTTKVAQSQTWIKTGLADLADQMGGDLGVGDLSHQVVNFLARYTDAQMGTLYTYREDDRTLQFTAGFAVGVAERAIKRFALGEGLVGQAALDKKLLSVSQLPEQYARIVSGTGEAIPRHVLVLPIVYEDQLKGVIELARLSDFDANSVELLTLASDAIGVALFTAESVSRTRRLLQETQDQARQLQMQQEELQQQNEELEEQTQALKSSEVKLKTQQEELQQTNEELEEHTQLLSQNSAQIARKNNELELAQADLQKRAEDLAQASRYKSEFLANMSHELRTPLNSMLLLARSLSDNRDGNLSAKQVQSAKTMHQSGNDLLAIINDILDLSKIEAGREKVELGSVDLKELMAQMHALYEHAAEEKHLEFAVTLANDLPAAMHSDRQRLAQILRNLLSNAFKFTQQGSVTVSVERYSAADDTVAFVVSDSGIGIPKEQQQQIWEAFRQADGTTSRKYGGTGLGLTISRELARLLGGKIELVSEAGRGAVFTLYLPVNGPATVAQASEVAKQNAAPPATPAPTIQRIADDRASVSKDESVILVVEDDPHFAQLLVDLCHEQGMKVLVSPTAEEALSLLNDYAVQGVMLDMLLPVRDGWSVLTRIKQELDTMHIPVYVISAEERNRQALQHGAIGFLRKPVSQEQLQAAYAAVNAAQGHRVKSILLVEDDDGLRGAVRDLLEADDVVIHEACDGAAALASLKANATDLIILDLGLPDMTGFELLEKIRAQESLVQPHVIVSTGRDLSREEYDLLQRHAINVIIKGVRSDERLVEEATMFLHRRVASLPDRARKMLLSLHDRDALFTGKQVLLVDDDIRNVYSLSGVLEERGIKVLSAKNGHEALAVLDKNPKIDLLLTDIMMPVMDGYELTRSVRRQERFARLPILALTAKAMQDDRDQCIAAGASDYLAKPVDLDRLLSMLRVWLYR